MAAQMDTSDVVEDLIPGVLRHLTIAASRENEYLWCVCVPRAALASVWDAQMRQGVCDSVCGCHWSGVAPLVRATTVPGWRNGRFRCAECGFLGTRISNMHTRTWWSYHVRSLGIWCVSTT